MEDISLISIHEDQDREAWAPPRQIIRENRTASLVAAGTLISPLQAVLNEIRTDYHWRDRRRRSQVYLTTLIRLREVGWASGKKEKKMEEQPTRVRKSKLAAEPSLTKTGQMIRDKRIALGLTQEQAAVASGYGKTGFHSIESGTRIPQPRKLSGIAKGLGIDFETLVDTVNRDRQELGKGLGQQSHLGYHPPPDEPGEINRRVVIDYLVHDMDFPRGKVGKVVENKPEYTDEDIKGYIEQLMKM